MLFGDLFASASGKKKAKDSGASKASGSSLFSDNNPFKLKDGEGDLFKRIDLPAPRPERPTFAAAAAEEERPARRYGGGGGDARQGDLPSVYMDFAHAQCHI
jgi:hypothetical protein